MANVANTANTGPASKDMVSGGKTFSTPKPSSVVSSGLGTFTNSPGNVESTIMGLRYQGGSFATSNPAGTLAKLQPKNVTGVSGGKFSKT